MNIMDLFLVIGSLIYVFLTIVVTKYLREKLFYWKRITLFLILTIIFLIPLCMIFGSIDSPTNRILLMILSFTLGTCIINLFR